MNSLSDISTLFDRNLRSVDELVIFDKLILDVCITSLDRLNHKLKNGPFQINNPAYLAENALQNIKNIRHNDSLKLKYASMFNSCLVLQVSYFTSALDDLFRYTTSKIIPDSTTVGPNFNELRKSNSINFQNMKSATRTFEKFLDIKINNDSTCNTVALAQMARHAIVHSLGIADEKFIAQAETVKPRDIKTNFSLNEKIYFSSSELQYVSMAMQMVIGQICDKINARYLYIN